MTTWLPIVLAGVTLVTAFIGFVALLARASNATATVESLRGEISDKDRRIDDLKDDLHAETTKRQELQAQVSVLDERVTQRARVDDLAKLVADNFTEVKGDLQAIRQRLDKGGVR